MKILFAATRAWDDLGSVATILDSIVGDAPVHIVTGAETRGPEAFVVEWARQRARLRRTSIDVLKAGKEYGSDRAQWKPRRDAHMVRQGGYDAAVILSRVVDSSKSTRLDDLATMAAEAGIDVQRFDYDATVNKQGATK